MLQQKSVIKCKDAWKKFRKVAERYYGRGLKRDKTGKVLTDYIEFELKHQIFKRYSIDFITMGKFIKIEENSPGSFSTIREEDANKGYIAYSKTPFSKGKIIICAYGKTGEELRNNFEYLNFYFHDNLR